MRSMGLVETESSKSSSSGSEPEAELSSSDGQPTIESEVPKPKPKHHSGHPRKPHIIKEKVYKSTGAPRQPGGGVHYVENNLQNK